MSGPCSAFKITRRSWPDSAVPATRRSPKSSIGTEATAVTRTAGQARSRSSCYEDQPGSPSRPEPTTVGERHPVPPRGILPQRSLPLTGQVSTDPPRSLIGQERSSTTTRPIRTGDGCAPRPRDLRSGDRPERPGLGTAGRGQVRTCVLRLGRRYRAHPGSQRAGPSGDNTSIGPTLSIRPSGEHARATDAGGSAMASSNKESHPGVEIKTLLNNLRLLACSLTVGRTSNLDAGAPNPSARGQ